MAFSSTGSGIEFNYPLKDILKSGNKYTDILDADRYADEIGKFEKASNKGGDSLENFRKQSVDAKNGIADYAESVGDAATSFDGYTRYVNEANKAQKKMTVGQKALSFGTSLLSGVLNMGTGMLAGVAISGIVTLIDGIVHRSDNLIQAGEEAKSEIQTISQEYDTHKQAVDSVIDSYDTLRAKVDQSTNKNMGLSTEQYQQFLDTNNQLAEMFPTLVSGYDSQGNAIINLGNSASEAQTKLEGLLESEQEANSVKIAEKGQEHYEGVAEQAKKIEKDISKQQDAYESAMKTVEKYSDSYTDMTQNLKDRSVTLPGDENGVKMKNILEKELMDQGIAFNTTPYANEQGGSDYIITFNGELSEESIQRINDQAEAASQGTIDSYQEAANNSLRKMRLDEQELKAKWAELAPTVSEAVKSSSAFKGLGDTLQSGILSNIGNFDFSLIKSKFGGNFDKFIYEGIVRPIASGSEEVQSAYEQLFALENDRGDLSVREWADRRDALIDTISGGDKEVAKGIAQMMGYVDENGGKVKQGLDEIVGHFFDDINSSEAKAFREDLKDLTGDEYEIALDLVLSNAEDLDTVSEFFDKIEESKGKISDSAYDVEAMTNALSTAISSQSNINQALKNSTSSTGLLTDDITNLASAFSEVDGYNPSEIFEKTASGIRINRDALSAYQAEQEKVTKQNFAKALELQNEELAEQVELLNSAKTADEKNAAEAGIETIQAQIESLKQLQAQYNGATSDYSKWMNALSNGEEGGVYDTVATNWQSARELAEEGLIGTDEFKTAVDYMYSGSLDNQSPEEVKAVYDELNGLVSQWYQTNEDGSLNAKASMDAFCDSAESIGDVLGTENPMTQIDEEAKKATLNAKEFADAWGVSEEVVTDIAGKLRDYGWDVDVTGVTSDFEVVASTAEEASKKVHNLFDDNYDYDFNTKDAEKSAEQLNHIAENMGQFRNEDGSYNYDINGAKEMMTMYEATARNAQKIEKSTSALGQVDADNVTEATKESVQAIQDYMDKKNELDVQSQKAQQGDSSGLGNAQAEADSALQSLRELQEAGKLPFDIDLSDLQSAEDSILGLTDEEVRMKLGIDTEDSQKQIQQEAESVQKSLQESAEASGDLDLANALDFDMDTMSIDELKSKIQELNSLKANPEISPENASQLETVIDGCESKVDELNGKKATPEFATDGIQQGASLIEQFNSQFDQLNALQANPKVDASQVEQVQSQLMDTATQISQLSPEIKAQLGIEGETPEEIAAELAADQVEIPVTVKMEDGQFSALMEGITGEPYEAEVDVTANTDGLEEGKQIELEATVGEVDTSSVDATSGEEVEIPVTVKLDESQFSALTQGMSGDPVEIPTKLEDPEMPDTESTEKIEIPAEVGELEMSSVESQEMLKIPAEIEELDMPSLEYQEMLKIPAEVEPPDLPEIPEGDTVEYPSEVEPPDTPSVEGEPVEYPSTVTPPDPPDVQGDTVEYPSEVTPPETPTVETPAPVEIPTEVEPPTTPEVPEGGTVTYDSTVEQPDLPSPPEGGTVNYTSDVETPNPPAPPTGGTVNYSSTVDTPTPPAPPAGGTVHYSATVDPPTITDEQATVNYTVNDPPPPNYPDQNPSVNYHLNAPAPPSYPNISRTITYTIQTIGSIPGKASGTMLSPSAFPARASGTAYNVINYKNAYAGGKVSLPKDETALVNELGGLMPSLNLSNAGIPLEPCILQHSHEIRADVNV